MDFKCGLADKRAPQTHSLDHVYYTEQSKAREGNMAGAMTGVCQLKIFRYLERNPRN